MPVNTNDPLSEIRNAIDEGVKNLSEFSPEAIGAAQKAFRFWHVELLLDQSADLLDRCLRDRAAYDDLRSRFANLVLGVTSFARTDAVLKDEVAANAYKQDYLLSGAQYNAYDDQIGSYKSAHDVLQSLVDPSVDSNAALDPANFSKTAQGDIVQTAEFWITRKQTISQMNSTQAEVDLTSKMRDAYLARSQFDRSNYTSNPNINAPEQDKNNPGFRERRDGVARDVNGYTETLMTDSGLAYNYRDQSDHLQTRFLRDFRDAYVRMRVARDGLQLIYGKTIDGFPDVDDSAFDKSVTWVRDAIRYLAGFAQLDQCYVLTISVRQLTTDTEWKNAIAAARPGAPVTFNFLLDEATLGADQRHVRLRGIGACVTGSDGPWQLSIKPPATSVVHYLAANAVVNVDQPDVPPVRLGRVLSRSGQIAPDLSGVASLRNVSPLSRDKNASSMWSVTVIGSASPGDTVDVLKDVQLDLQLVMQSAV
jgi:hypothetical protein